MYETIQPDQLNQIIDAVKPTLNHMVATAVRDRVQPRDRQIKRLAQ